MSLGAAKAAMLGAAGAGGPEPLPVGLTSPIAADALALRLYGEAGRGSSGDLYASGYYNDTADANQNVCLVKYDSTNMSLLWAKHVSSAAATGAELCRGLTVVSDGIVLLQYQYIVDKFVPIISKLDFDGALVWTKHLTMGAVDNAYSVLETSTGDLVLVGADSTLGMYVVKVSSTGDLVWAKHYNNSQTHQAAQAVIDSSDNVYIAYYSLDTEYYAGVVKLNSAGTLQAQPRFNLGTPALAFSLGVSLDSAGNVYLAGVFTDVTTSDIFVMKLNGSLVPQWTRKLKAAPTDQNDQAACTVGPDDMVYVNGYTADVDAVADGLLAKYDTNGVLQWKRSMVSGTAIFVHNGALLIDDTNLTAIGAKNSGTVFEGLLFTVPIDGTGLGTYDDMVYADATNVTDSAYAGVTQYSTFGLTESVAGDITIGAGDEVVTAAPLTSIFYTGI